MDELSSAEVAIFQHVNRVKEKNKYKNSGWGVLYGRKTVKIWDFLSSISPASCLLFLVRPISVAHFSLLHTTSVLVWRMRTTAKQHDITGTEKEAKIDQSGNETHIMIFFWLIVFENIQMQLTAVYKNRFLKRKKVILHIREKSDIMEGLLCAWHFIGNFSYMKYSSNDLHCLLNKITAPYEAHHTQCGLACLSDSPLPSLP